MGIYKKYCQHCLNNKKEPPHIFRKIVICAGFPGKERYRKVYPSKIKNCNKFIDRRTWA